MLKVSFQWKNSDKICLCSHWAAGIILPPFCVFMPGIGIGTAVVLLCELGSLKNYPTRQKITAVHFIWRLRVIAQNVANDVSVTIPDSMPNILPLEGQIWLLFLEVRQTYAKHLSGFIHRDQFRYHDGQWITFGGDVL